MFYANQKRAGDECLELLMSGKRIIRLCAQMQSGKTGTYGYIAHSILNVSEFKNTYKKVVVFCQESNIALKTQIENDLSFLPKDFVEVYHRATAKDIERNANERSQTLFIFDESHIAQKQTNIPFKIIRKCVLKDLSNAIILVSATNFIADLNKNIPKVILNPGVGYYGIQDMFKNNKIFQSNKVLQKGTKKLDSLFINALQRMQNKTYGVVRVHTNVIAEKIKSIINKQFKEIKVIVINSVTNKELMDLALLDGKPNERTVILINNLARCGKQINTEHCSFMWDTEFSNTDTCVQSLLGRCCGYGKMNHNVEIYTDYYEAKNYLNYVESLYDVDRMDSFKESGTTKNTKNILGEVPKVIRCSNLKQKISKYKNTKEAIIAILKNLNIDHPIDSSTVRDFSNATGKANRRLDILEAIELNQGYWYGEKSEVTHAVSICSKNDEIYLLKKLQNSGKIVNITKPHTYISDAL